jgi:16S rRNA processing protein RimM
VTAIFPTGSNDVYVVRDGEKEVLIPAIDSVVVHIDLIHGVLRVDLPEGLED